MAANEEVLDHEDIDITLNSDDVEDDVDVGETENTPEERDWNAEAKSMGWNSNYEGDDAVDAREYVLRKPIFDNLKRVKRKARDLEAALKSQQQVIAKIIDKQRKEEAASVEKRRKAAIDEGDIEKALTYDAELKAITAAPAPPAAPVADPVFETWLEHNPWYEDDEDARLFADAYADALVRSAGGKLSQTDIFQKTTERVLRRFPELSKKKATRQDADVETSQGRGGSTRKTVSSYKLKIPKEFRRVAESQIASGAFGDVSKEAGYKAYYEGLLVAGIVEEDE